MDPSQAQSDSSNDVHSLEHEDAQAHQGSSAANKAASGANEAGVTDATGDENLKPAPPSPFKHRSLIRRLWDRFNIYLVLFVFVMVLAIGGLIVLTLKSKEDARKNLTSQGLTQDALKQLASTDVTVGTPKQILTIQANAVFAGAVLIRGDLEVAGALRLGGKLSLSDLAVSGTSTLSDVNANNITIGNNLNVQGTLTLKSGISVAGQSNFNGGIVTSSITAGVLQLNGNLKLTHHITAGGTLPSIVKGSAVGSGGTVSLSGSDTAGSVTINTGSSPPAGCFATITFSETFDNVPHVVIAPVGTAAASLNYYITRSTTNFIICTTSAASSGQSFGFDYIVMG